MGPPACARLSAPAGRARTRRARTPSARAPRPARSPRAGTRGRPARHRAGAAWPLRTRARTPPGTPRRRTAGMPARVGQARVREGRAVDFPGWALQAAQPACRRARGSPGRLACIQQPCRTASPGAHPPGVGTCTAVQRACESTGSTGNTLPGACRRPGWRCIGTGEQHPHRPRARACQGACMEGLRLEQVLVEAVSARANGGRLAHPGAPVHAQRGAQQARGRVAHACARAPLCLGSISHPTCTKRPSRRGPFSASGRLTWSSG